MSAYSPESPYQPYHQGEPSYYAPTSPPYKPASPEYGSSTPTYKPMSPEYGSTTPTYKPTSPEYGSTSPKYLPNPDPFASNCTSSPSDSPYNSQRNPFLPRVPDYAPPPRRKTPDNDHSIPSSRRPSSEPYKPPVPASPHTHSLDPRLETYNPDYPTTYAPEDYRQPEDHHSPFPPPSIHHYPSHHRLPSFPPTHHSHHQNKFNKGANTGAYGTSSAYGPSTNGAFAYSSGPSSSDEGTLPHPSKRTYSGWFPYSIHRPLSPPQYATIRRRRR